MKKEDAKYILDAIEWMNENTTVASVDMETYGNLFMNSQCLLMDVVNSAEKSDTQALNLPVVNGWLSIKECAKLYGTEIEYKWLSPDGNDWLNKKGIVNASVLSELEKGSIKEACR